MHAATLTYSDTSVSVADNTTPVVDAFTGITAPRTTDLTPGTSLTLTAAGNALGTLKWTNATAVSGTDTATLPVPASGASVNAAVTDGAAAASVAIVAAANATTTSNVNLTLTPDTVTLPVATTDNTTGDVVFGTVPAGVTETLGNAPVGVALSNGVLSATSAVPGVYKNVTVTATNSNGATAVETLAIDVKGTVVNPTPPVREPRPHLYNGHVITVNNNDDDIQLIPAGTNKQPLPNAATGWIYIRTTS